MENTVLISGAISVKAAVECGKRQVAEVYADKNKITKSKDFGYIRALCRDKGIPFIIKDGEFFSREEFGSTHGGIGALVGEMETADEEVILSADRPFIAVLDGIEDPFNFGCAVRTLYAAGATGIVLPERNWLSASGIVLRSSAGASERIDCAVTADIPAFITKAKQKGITVLAADRRDAVPLYGEKLDGPVLLLVGGEKRGISSEILSLADKRIYIPYGREFRNALSASAAVSVFAFEIYRQRNSGQ